MPAFLWGERRQAVGDNGPEFVDGSGGGPSEQGLELGEGHLDGVEVRRVWRQEQEPRADLLDCLAHAADPVGRQIVHDHDVAGSKLRCENLLGIGEEGWPVHGAVEEHRCCHAGQSQAGGEGGGLPMAVGNSGSASLAAWCPASQPGHLRGRRGLVDEDQLFGIEVELTVEPGYAAAQDIGALMLGGVRRLFLNVMPRRSRNSQTVDGAARTPRSAARRSPISASVTSGASSMRPRMKASCTSSFEREGWPCLRAAISPVSR